MGAKTFADFCVENNRRYAENFDQADAPALPRSRAAVVACMDARIETGRLLGLSEGDAHVIRNAGGVVTDDVLRSLLISQRMLGTEEIILVQHTDCGMLTFRDDDVKTRSKRRPVFGPHSRWSRLRTLRKTCASRFAASRHAPSSP